MTMPARCAIGSDSSRCSVPLFEPLENRRLLAATLLIDAVPGAEGSDPRYCGMHEGQLVFVTRPDADSGTTHVWLSDGSPEGTRQVGTIPAGIMPTGGGGADAVVNEGKLYFRPSDVRGFGTSIGSMDLSSGIVSRSGPSPSPERYDPYSLEVRDGYVTYTCFYRYPRGFGHGVFRLGAGMLYADTPRELERFTVRGRGLEIIAPQSGGASHLFQAGRQFAEPTPQLIKENVPTQRMVPVDGGLALFVMNQSEVWATDGTAAGTRKLVDVEALGTSSLMAFSNGRIIYARHTPEHGMEVWSQPLAYTVPAVPPAPSAPALAPGMDTGVSSTDLITRLNRPTFVGQAQPGSIVTLLANGMEMGTARVGADGHYSITPISDLRLATDHSAQLGAGNVRVRVSITDANGNVSEASSPLDLVVDPHAPIKSWERGIGSGDRRGVTWYIQDLNVIDLSGVTATTVLVRNVTTGQILDPSAISISLQQQTGARPLLTLTGSFERLHGGELPAGRYQMSLLPGSIRDIAGNVLTDPLTLEVEVQMTSNPTPVPSLLNGVLWVNGTPGSDAISIARSPSRPERLVVLINGMRSVVNVSDVQMIRSELGDGDDQFFVKENGGRIAINTSVVGGLGNDTIHTASGTDTLYGQAGNDVLSGGDGVDRLYGGDGTDHLIGGLGRDIIYGHAGRDLFSKIDAAFEWRDRNLDELIR